MHLQQLDKTVAPKLGIVPEGENHTSVEAGRRQQDDRIDQAEGGLVPVDDMIGLQQEGMVEAPVSELEDTAVHVHEKEDVVKHQTAEENVFERTTNDECHQAEGNVPERVNTAEENVRQHENTPPLVKLRHQM